MLAVMKMTKIDSKMTEKSGHLTKISEQKKKPDMQFSATFKFMFRILRNSGPLKAATSQPLLCLLGTSRTEHRTR